MGSLFLRRLGFSLFSLLIVSLLLFVLTRSIPESPARIVLGDADLGHRDFDGRGEAAVEVEGVDIGDLLAGHVEGDPGTAADRR